MVLQIHSFFDFFYIIYFKAKSDLNYNYKTETINGFVAKDFDKLLIFAKTKKQGKHKFLLTEL